MGVSGQPFGSKRAAVIVAHPDDETLWAGGTILMHPDWRWTVIALCRGSDNDRAPKYRRVLQEMGAQGVIGDIDDSPEQPPIPQPDVQSAILSLLPSNEFDLILTHSPSGEYTRHLRHEETSRAVIHLWQTGKIKTEEMWLFAYEDGNRQYLPRAIKSAHRLIRLPRKIRENKYRIITQLYGFTPESWEAKTTPGEEAFWCFQSAREFREWLNKKE
jgi:LmbE family N-acetylglucosaminyl deacetylase